MPQVAGALTAETIAQMAQQRQKQLADDQLYRSVHVAGFKKGTPLNQIIGLCRNFGEAITGRLDYDPNGEPFALVEFREAAQAHACKTQARCFFEGQLVTFSQAKTVVDPALLAEQTVQFENGLMAPMNQRQILATQGHLSSKLAQVQAAASKIFSGERDASPELEANGKEGRPRKSPRGSRSRSKSDGRREERRKDKGQEKAKGKERSSSSNTSSNSSASSSDSTPKGRKSKGRRAVRKERQKKVAERPRSRSRRGRAGRSRDKRR